MAFIAKSTYRFYRFKFRVSATEAKTSSPVQKYTSVNFVCLVFPEKAMGNSVKDFPSDCKHVR